MEKELFVVGIGASAGGLTPLKSFFDSIPADSGMAFIVIQHLDPSHESMLPEILDRECKIKVIAAVNNTVLEANNVYVIPPDTYLEIDNNTIVLSKPPQKRGSRRAIDHLFRSMAASNSTSRAAIVLSGSGSDGTAGLRALRASGGAYTSPTSRGG